MQKKPKLAVIVEKKLTLRKTIKNHTFANKNLDYASPSQARRSIVTSRTSGLLIISNNDHTIEGYNLIQFCRARLANWVIIVLDYLNTPQSAVEAFNAGADDLIHAPFAEEELIARVNLRVSQSQGQKNNNTSSTPQSISDAKLTHTELEIMTILLSHKGKIVTRNELSKRIENQDWTYGDRKYDVHITNIRKKLESCIDAKYTVKSVRSVGYYAQEVNAIRND